MKRERKRANGTLLYHPIGLADKSVHPPYRLQPYRILNSLSWSA
jgi:hypothetical protein